MGKFWRGTRCGFQAAALLTILVLAGCGGSEDEVERVPVAAEATSSSPSDPSIPAESTAESELKRALAAGAAATGIRLQGFPESHQLYARARIGDGSVDVVFTATSASATVTSLTLISTPEGGASSRMTTPIGRGQTVTLRGTIPVALRATDFKLVAESPGGATLVAQASDVVAGDVYVVQGQSNARATVHFEQDALVERDAASRWIRTVGGMWGNTAQSQADLGWYVAKGAQGIVNAGIVGKWPLRMARDLVDRQQVPIAIFNGAHGGKPISWFLPGYVQADDPGNNYQRLMDRLNAYHLAESVRALIYYQGEADTAPGAETSQWTPRFASLLEAWNASFPNLAHVYLTQIRGCSDQPSTASIREQQRQFASSPKVQVMSTSAMGGFDGCHFYYTGYQQLGHWYARLLSHDLYGGDGSNTSAPAPVAIRRSADARQLYILLANRSDPISVDAASNADFIVATTTGQSLAPTQVAGRAGLLTLSLPPGVVATAVSYRGHRSDGRPWITNGNGVGLLAFEAMPVTP